MIHSLDAAGNCTGCPRKAACRAVRDASLHLEAFGRVCRGSAAGAAARAFDAARPHHPEEPTPSRAPASPAASASPRRSSTPAWR
jgi:hypothetical protein